MTNRFPDARPNEQAVTNGDHAWLSWTLGLEETHPSYAIQLSCRRFAIASRSPPFRLVPRLGWGQRGNIWVRLREVARDWALAKLAGDPEWARAAKASLARSRSTGI